MAPRNWYPTSEDTYLVLWGPMLMNPGPMPAIALTSIW